jgi:hypothetical protein
MTKEVLESDVYEVFERIQDPNLVYPDCQLTFPCLAFSLISFNSIDYKISPLYSVGGEIHQPSGGMHLP